MIAPENVRLDPNDSKWRFFVYGIRENQEQKICLMNFWFHCTEIILSMLNTLAEFTQISQLSIHIKTKMTFLLQRHKVLSESHSLKENYI